VRETFKKCQKLVRLKKVTEIFLMIEQLYKLFGYLQRTFCIMDEQVNFYSKLKLLNVGIVRNVYKVIEVKPEAE